MGLYLSRCWSSSPNPPTTTGSFQNQGGSNGHSNGIDYSTTTAATGSSFDPSQPSEQWSETSDWRNPSGQILETPNLRVYTFAELKTATKNFRADTLLGQGGFGKVYKGWVDEKTLSPSKMGSGMIVAIKKLNPESLQGFQEWRSEVIFLGRLSHPNLVKLLGYCGEEKELLLVYEFLPRGSLENHLFRRNPALEPLSWELRLKIMIGAARGLAFLHSSDREVIYRDFKASNILLDTNYNAKISDFGLAKLGPSGENTHVTTRIMGTYGYAAPEYMATGHLYVKSDVYAFGVVLLEIMTGLRAHDTRRPDGQKSLVDWQSPSLSDKKKLKAIMDPRIKGQYSMKAATDMAQITLKCVEPEPRNRPAMTEVVHVLENIGRLEILERSVPSSSSHPTPRSYRNVNRASGNERRSPARPKGVAVGM